MTRHIQCARRPSTICASARRPKGTRQEEQPVSSKSKQHKHHTESSKSHNARKEHDRKARVHTDDVYEGGGVSKNVRLAMVVIVAVVVITLTVLFMAGLIGW